MPVEWTPEIWGVWIGQTLLNLRSSRRNNEKYCLLGCGTVSSSRSLPNFQKNVLSPFSWLKSNPNKHHRTCRFIGLLFDPEDGSNRFHELSVNLYQTAWRHNPENSGPTHQIRLPRTAKRDEKYGTIFWVVTSGSTNYTASHNSEDRTLCSYHCENRKPNKGKQVSEQNVK